MLPVVTDQAFINAAIVAVQGQKYAEFNKIIARNKDYFIALTKLIQLDFDGENVSKVSEFLCSAMVLLNEQCKLEQCNLNQEKVEYKLTEKFDEKFGEEFYEKLSDILKPSDN